MRDERRGRSQGMERVHLESHSLRYRIAGAGEPPFVCLHGLVDTLEIWDPLIGALAERRRSICFDQRAHGESEAPAGPYRREDLAADVIGVLDALHVERAILVGHSMGGIVSMATALARPERIAGLVLLGTASRCNERTADWYERIALSAEEHGAEGLARSIYGKRTSKRIDGDAAGIAHVTRTLKSLYSDPLTPKLAELQCPALLLVGENDPMGPKASETIATALADATLEVLAGRGHWVHVEAPDAVVAAIDRWLPRLKG